MFVLLKNSFGFYRLQKNNVIFINNISICSHFRITIEYLQYIVLPCVKLFHICPWNLTFRCLLTMFYISIFLYYIYCIMYTLHRYNPISFKMDNLYSNIFHMIHRMLWSATVVYFFRRLTFEKMIDSQFLCLLLKIYMDGTGKFCFFFGSIFGYSIPHIYLIISKVFSNFWKL